MPRRRRQENDSPTEIEQLLQLAQLSQLLQKPQQETAELGQRDENAKLTAAIHLIGLQQEAKNNAETNRFREGELANRSAAIKANTLESTVGHLASRPDVPLGVLADVINSGGDLSQAIRTVDRARATKIAHEHSTNLDALLGQGKDFNDPVAQTLLQTVKSDPLVEEEFNKIRPQGGGGSWGPETPGPSAPSTFGQTPMGSFSDILKLLGRGLAPIYRGP